jgi:hypothetical protein
MFRILILPSLAIISAIGSAAFAQPGPKLYEEMSARLEERQIIAEPIGGIQNSFWFDYRINVNEAGKELTSDLRHASDTEDLRDAWEEYHTELAHERRHYVDEMAERGYRYSAVFVGE